MKLERAVVLSQEELYENTYLMWLSCPPVAKGASPGRFLMLHCGDAYDPPLPRPMSFHRFRDTEGERQFAILYDVRGRGTTWLSARKPGDLLTVFGPLRRGCGTGICYGCAVFTRRGVRLVCKDGPRFELRQVFS